MVKTFSLPGFDETDTYYSQTTEGASDSDDCDDFSSIEEIDRFYALISDGHIPCFAHTLQRVIKDAFKEAAGLNKVL